MKSKDRRRQKRLARHKARRKDLHQKSVKIGSCAPSPIAADILRRHHARTGETRERIAGKRRGNFNVGQNSRGNR